MKRILIFSDTHGDINPCLEVIRSFGHTDAIIHAGDYARDAEELEYIYPDIPLYYVKGNNDIFSRAPSHITVLIGGKRIYLTHGHEQNVKYESNYSTLRAAAEKANSDLVIFGHTHVPYTSYDGGMTVLNPGSARFSRTCAEAEIDGDTLKTKIIEI